MGTVFPAPMLPSIDTKTGSMLYKSGITAGDEKMDNAVGRLFIWFQGEV